MLKDGTVSVAALSFCYEKGIIEDLMKALVAIEEEFSEIAEGPYAELDCTGGVPDVQLTVAARGKSDDVEDEYDRCRERIACELSDKTNSGGMISLAYVVTEPGQEVGREDYAYVMYRKEGVSDRTKAPYPSGCVVCGGMFREELTDYLRSSFSLRLCAKAGYPKYSDHVWVLKGGRVVEEKESGKAPRREGTPLIRTAFEEAEELRGREQEREACRKK